MLTCTRLIAHHCSWDSWQVRLLFWWVIWCSVSCFIRLLIGYPSIVAPSSLALLSVSSTGRRRGSFEVPSSMGWLQASLRSISWMGWDTSSIVICFISLPLERALFFQLFSFPKCCVYCSWLYVWTKCVPLYLLLGKHAFLQKTTLGGVASSTNYPPKLF